MPPAGTSLFLPPRESANVPPFLRGSRRRREKSPIRGREIFAQGGRVLFAAFGGGGVRTLRRAAGELLPGGSRGIAKGGTGHLDRFRP